MTNPVPDAEELRRLCSEYMKALRERSPMHKICAALKQRLDAESGAKRSGDVPEERLLNLLYAARVTLDSLGRDIGDLEDLEDALEPFKDIPAAAPKVEG